LRRAALHLSRRTCGRFIRERRWKTAHWQSSDGKPDLHETFADSGLKQPFGIAFYPPGPQPQYLYVANTDGVIRFPYRNGDTKTRASAEKLAAELSASGLCAVAGIGCATLFS